MNPLKHIRRFAAALAGLAGALVAFGATPAFAMHVPPPGSGSGVTTSPVGTTPPVEVHTVVVGGMPGWQIALIAVVAALVAATVAVLTDRARTARRKVIPATA
jgi:hypothetical protein